MENKPHIARVGNHWGVWRDLAARHRGARPGILTGKLPTLARNWTRVIQHYTRKMK